jgi:peroxiredoxin
MSRLLSFAVICLLILGLSAAAQEQQPPKKATVIKIDKDFKLAARLSGSDPKDSKINGPSQIHIVEMKAGFAYTIDMISTELDSYLRLEDKTGKQLDEDDDSGGNLNAKMVFNCTKDDEYKVICTCLGGPDRNGNYTLLIKKAVSNVATVTPHDKLIDKRAPQLQGDFALNGKAIKLSDLRGKVVFLEFMDARSDACMAALARLRDWNTKFKGEGLEVVSVTFYPHDFAQKLRFDKDAGRLAQTDKADKQTDQAALKDFAEYHKLEHLLMTLPKDDAMKAFGDYAVNGVPQAVLIDREGLVRMIRHDDEKTAPALEAEIKKLLSQK